MYRNALRTLLERSTDSWCRGSHFELPSIAVAALQQALSTSTTGATATQKSSAEGTRDQGPCGPSSRAASTQQPGYPGNAQRLPGPGREHWHRGVPQGPPVRLHEPACGLDLASMGQRRLFSAASGGGEGPVKTPGEGEHEGLPQGQGQGQASAADGGGGSAGTRTKKQDGLASSTGGGGVAEGEGQREGQAGASAGGGLLDSSTGQQEGTPPAQRGKLSDAEFMTSAPPTEPLRPGRRGSAAWEPFAADDNTFEGLEEYGGAIETINDYDELLDQWGDLMERGEFGAVLSLLQQRLPPNPDIPPLDELINWKSPREEAREARAAIEAALQQELAARRVRTVDSAGRAYATGRRKTSVARVWIWPGPGSIMVNARTLDMHFPELQRRAEILAPFQVTGTLGEFCVFATVAGGGSTGQAQAVRHGVACALQKWDPGLRPPLKRAGYLTRDSRIVERKKPGRAKARKAFAWVKR